MTGINIVLVGTYYDYKTRIGGPGQIFSMIVDTLIRRHKALPRNTRIVIVNISSFPFQIYEVSRRGVRIRASVIEALRSSIQGTIICICGLTIKGLILALLAFFLQRKICYYMHGLDLLEYRYENRRLVRLLPYILAELILLRISRSLVTVSNLYKNLVEELLKFTRGKEWFVVPNGLYLEMLYRRPRLVRELGVISPSEYILYVGRPTPCKGFKVLPLLLNYLRKRARGDIYILAVVGNVQYAQIELQKYKTYNEFYEYLIRHLILLPHISKDVLVELYEKARFVIIPSMFESFNMVALESLALGTPIVISKNCGVVDFLPRDNPCVCVYENIRDMYMCIDRLLSASVNKDNCKQIALKFSITQTVVQLLRAIIISLVKSSK